MVSVVLVASKNACAEALASPACHDLNERVSASLASLQRQQHLKRIFVVASEASISLKKAIQRARPDAQFVNIGDDAGFAEAANSGLREVQTPFALIVRAGEMLQHRAVEELVSAALTDPNAAAVGPWMTRRSRPVRRMRSGTTWESRSSKCRDVPIHHVEFLSQRVVLLRMSLLHQIGLFDERFKVAFAGDDLCARAQQAGYHLLLSERGLMDSDSSNWLSRITKSVSGLFRHENQYSPEGIDARQQRYAFERLLLEQKHRGEAAANALRERWQVRSSLLARTQVVVPIGRRRTRNILTGIEQFRVAPSLSGDVEQSLPSHSQRVA